MVTGGDVLAYPCWVHAADEGQIVIFDATNTTEERRQMLVWQLESVIAAHYRWEPDILNTAVHK